MIIVSFVVSMLMLFSLTTKVHMADFDNVFLLSQRVLWTSLSVGTVLVFSDLFQGELTWYKLTFFLAFVPALTVVIRNKILANREQQPAEVYMESRNRSYRFLYYVCRDYSIFYIMAATFIIAVINSPLVE